MSVLKSILKKERWIDRFEEGITEPRSRKAERMAADGETLKKTNLKGNMFSLSVY